MSTNRLDRRGFLHLSAGVATTALVSPWIPKAFALGQNPAATFPVPNRPRTKPLDWRARADAFDSYVMDPQNKILRLRPDGTTYFASALEGTGDGGLTTFAPLLLGKLLRDNQVDALLPSMGAYFSEQAGIFLDGTHAELCEYWYLMNVNALADAIIALHYRHDPLWRSRVRRSADRLIALARQIRYDFNDQGYRFNTSVPFTNKDIYRQPDTIGGYAYVLLFAHELLGDAIYLEEARKAIGLYQSFPKNPWYEVPSGALASLAAARLSRTEAGFDMEKILGFVLDPGGRPLQTGEWGGQEVNGLMAGFCTEPEGQAYSMESLMTLPYLLPVLRYRPEYATLIGRYLLNTAANMRLFYADCIPKENQSRPDLTSAVPYERLTRELEGRSPSHRRLRQSSLYLWWRLRLDMGRTGQAHKRMTSSCRWTFRAPTFCARSPSFVPLLQSVESIEAHHAPLGGRALRHLRPGAAYHHEQAPERRGSPGGSVHGFTGRCSGPFRSKDPQTEKHVARRWCSDRLRHRIVAPVRGSAARPRCWWHSAHRPPRACESGARNAPICPDRPSAPMLP